MLRLDFHRRVWNLLISRSAMARRTRFNPSPGPWSIPMEARRGRTAASPPGGVSESPPPSSGVEPGPCLRQSETPTPTPSRARLDGKNDGHGDRGPAQAPGPAPRPGRSPLQPFTGPSAGASRRPRPSGPRPSMPVERLGRRCGESGPAHQSHHQVFTRALRDCPSHTGPPRRLRPRPTPFGRVAQPASQRASRRPLAPPRHWHHESSSRRTPASRVIRRNADPSRAASSPGGPSCAAAPGRRVTRG